MALNRGLWDAPFHHEHGGEKHPIKLYPTPKLLELKT
jgi:hypothetical protein